MENEKLRDQQSKEKDKLNTVQRSEKSEQRRKFLKVKKKLHACQGMVRYAMRHLSRENKKDIYKQHILDSKTLDARHEQEKEFLVKKHADEKRKLKERHQIERERNILPELLAYDLSTVEDPVEEDWVIVGEEGWTIVETRVPDVTDASISG